MKINLFSGGAAKAVVTGLQQDFEKASGSTMAAAFGAVGTMRDRLLAGEPCDVIILSDALIKDLEQKGHVVPGSARPLGRVDTGMAVRKGTAPLAMADSAQLKTALSQAAGFYVPNMEKSTAGIHIAGMLKKLGLFDALKDRIHEYPNGAVAMEALAETSGDGMIGCTQVTEIMYTPGITLVGELPSEFALSTIYTAALCTKAAQPDLARRFIETMASDGSKALRAEAGFGI
jgi:molybdate transport system substrate-binding protein